MRKSTFLFLLIFTSLTQTFKAQTRSETIDWLNGKFREYTSSSVMGEYRIDIIIGEADKETLLLTHTATIGTRLSKTKYYFSPNVISSVKTTTSYRTDGNLGIELFSRTRGIYKDGNNFTNVIPIYIKATTHDNVKRIQKGIIHLLNLMGNPITLPIELFTD